MNSFKIKSYAKINLALNVTGKKSKLHNIESLISFIDLHNGTQTNKVPDFCLVTTKFKYSNIGLTMDLRQDRCDNNNDILDVSRTLNFVSDTQLEYLIKNANVQCKFELKRL